MENSIIFTPCEIGPITLRNRVIRSAAFENMAYGNRPSDDLLNYHEAVARGGVGMTTVAYAAVNQSGLSFNGQLWMREEIVPDLKRLTTVGALRQHDPSVHLWLYAGWGFTWLQHVLANLCQKAQEIRDLFIGT